MTLDGNGLALVKGRVSGCRKSTSENSTSSMQTGEKMAIKNNEGDDNLTSAVLGLQDQN